MLTRKTLLRGLAALTAAVLFAQSASAGLPLVCNPFETGDARLLPWAKPAGAYTIDRRYDVDNLASDTLRLLTPDAPTLARMENLRRATHYALRDRNAATELLKAVLERAQWSTKDSRADALAWFDAGYLVETYRQHGMTYENDMLRAFDKAYPGMRQAAGALEGYPLVQKAIAVTKDPEMEYAASLMTHDATAVARHRAAASAGAKADSLLAMNLNR